MQLPGEREPVSYVRAAGGEEQPLPPRTGLLGRRRQENGRRPQCADRNVEIWKIKKLTTSFEAARGNDTSMSWEPLITSIQQKLKLYNKVPPNGLIVYCGTIVTQEGKEKKVNIDFELFKPINTLLYLCDNKFHTEALTALPSYDSKFGFIVIDGSGTLFGTLQGNTREVLHKFTVDLPKKHDRGDQSALRFVHLRMEK
ncbi:eukaryotic peptide chain release factor subunit 1 [Lynx pardinus]|uniref:Eukaryotic peptide chain release factor subunit 1 n=1 Tax=Lynx pardinus TaxID=191816 RepID=A0A485MAV2_LYNPA|nr:eukaryotic peptide chain release factor subunit 1 [Lynx pardinus]